MSADEEYILGQVLVERGIKVLGFLWQTEGAGWCDFICTYSTHTSTHTNPHTHTHTHTCV